MENKQRAIDINKSSLLNNITEMYFLLDAVFSLSNNLLFCMLNILNVPAPGIEQHEININMTFSGACTVVCEQSKQHLCSRCKSYTPNQIPNGPVTNAN